MGGSRWWDLVQKRPGVLTNMGSGSGWGGSPAPGGLAPSMRFDGVDDLISCGDVPAMAFGTGPFFISVVLKTSASSRVGIYGKCSSAGIGFYADIMATGVVRTAIANPATSFRVRDSSAAVNDGKWHWIVTSNLGGSNFPDIYIDGALSNGGTLTGGATPGTVTTTNPFIIGNSGLTGTGYLPGSISELSAYSRTASANDPVSLYIDSRLGCPWSLNRLGGLTAAQRRLYRRLLLAQVA